MHRVCNQIKACIYAGKTMLFTLAHAKRNKPAFDSNGKPLLNPEAERLYAKAMEMLKPSPQMIHSLYGSMGMARHKVEMFEYAIKYYERYLKSGKPGTAGYQFVEESIQYVKQENIPHLHKKRQVGHTTLVQLDFTPLKLGQAT